MNPYRLPANVLRALAHPARLRLLNALRHEEECVCHLTALLRQRQAYVSQQLMFLRQAGLIEDRKDGLRVYYRIKDPKLIPVLDAVNKMAGSPRRTEGRHKVTACQCPKCGQAHMSKRKPSCSRRDERSSRF